MPIVFGFFFWGGGGVHDNWGESYRGISFRGIFSWQMFLGINEVCTMRARSESGLFVLAIRVR